MTSKASQSCFLQPRDVGCPNIELPHKREANIADGGDRLIFDADLSESQLVVTANVDSCTLSVRAVNGKNFGCNGYRLRKNVCYKLNNNHKIHLDSGSKLYQVNFRPAETATEESMDTSESNNNEATWELIDNKELLIYTPQNSVNSSLIAAFDLDGTLIKTKSGARFPKDDDDWELLFGNVKPKLERLHEQNYKLVVLTNQAAIEGNHAKRIGFERKIENIVARLGLPLHVFVATSHSVYRKPVPGMWQVLTATKNGGLDVNMEKSFFVGDAAGRSKNWAVKKPKDHSLADRLFAVNVGLKFYTPEEYFLGAREAPYSMPKFNPRNVVTPDFSIPVSDGDQQEVIIMVGCAGSGKSFFCEKFLVSKGYVRVNRDKLGCWQKCVKVMEESLSLKKRVVVDNTNPTKESRKRYIEVAKRLNIPCRCFLMKVDSSHAKHNNKFRELTDKSHIKISDIVINSYYKSLEEPTLEEGFEEIVKVPFIPSFASEEQEKFYMMFLLSTI